MEEAARPEAGVSGEGHGGQGEVQAFVRLAGIVRRLRAPGGCPWDRAQTHASLRPFALEEAREVVAAIGDGDTAALREELGDLLLQVMLHAVIAEEEGAFSLTDVLAGLADKLVRRHPHVFGQAPPATSVAEVERRWEATKAAEDGVEGVGAPVEMERRLRRVRRGQPALSEAAELGAVASEVGFDWDGPEAAWPKVAEEEREFESAWRAWELRGRVAGEGARRAEEELGDLLFSAVQVARLLGLDAEVALARANDKFRRRFAAMADELAAEGRRMEGLSLAELDRVWERVKSRRPQHGA